MLIHSASQLLTLTKKPQRGEQLGQLNIIHDGAIHISNGLIDAVGSTKDLLAIYQDDEQLDAEGRVVMPGFVDPHTHVIWAGDRAKEFEQRLQGKTYLEILAEGGGILSTVESTRNADQEELISESKARLQKMFLHGSTTIEAKTGYGLSVEVELRLLQGLVTLGEAGPWDLVPTFLGAHAIPTEYADRADEYTQLVCSRMLPEVKSWWDKNVDDSELPFVDVFCETGAFNLAQTQKIFEVASAMGYKLKLHADEFDNLGGTSLGVALGAISIDHLVSASDEDIRRLGGSNTVAVGLPGTPFGLAEQNYAPAKKIIAAGGILAIASDINPGTSWCENMQVMLALACRYMRLTPAQAIAAATINAAAAIDRSDQIGSLDIGKQADMLILSVSDYRQLGYRYGTNLVDVVIKRGEIFQVKDLM